MRRSGARSSGRGVAADVALLGFQPNPFKFMARASVFVLPSRCEGFPNVLLEAMACGVPVITTDWAGAEEIVIDGVTGLIVPMDDEVKTCCRHHRDVERPRTCAPARGRRGTDACSCLRGLGSSGRYSHGCFRRMHGAPAHGAWRWKHAEAAGPLHRVLPWRVPSLPSLLRGRDPLLCSRPCAGSRSRRCLHSQRFRRRRLGGGVQRHRPSDHASMPSSPWTKFES